MPPVFKKLLRFTFSAMGLHHLKYCTDFRPVLYWRGRQASMLISLESSHRRTGVDAESHSRPNFVALFFRPGIVYSCAMPTVKDLPGPYRFFFYSLDCNEPMHVHVQREKMVCKFWLEPVELARNRGFPEREINMIRHLIESDLDKIRKAWNEHCNPD